MNSLPTRRHKPSIAALLLPLCLACAGPTATAASRPNAPRVYLLRRRALIRLRSELRRPRARLTPHLRAFLKQLEARARRDLHAGPYSVMDKAFTPPSGTKHDYMSWAPYFWPNPKTRSGLPYVHRDGLRNPQIRKITDHDELHRLIAASETLALAWYLTGRERYAAHAAALIRAWFLAPATRMNPNLNYAQGIPGRVNGRGIGIIDTAGLPHLIDALGLLAGSSAWRPADQAGMLTWFRQYLDWLRTSRNGRAEDAAKNNHGSWYDVQMVDESLFSGERGHARRELAAARGRRIARQILPSGRQPLETARTKSFQYSAMNLHALCALARLGRFAGVDLWHYRSPHGAGLFTALDYLLPYAMRRKRWPYQEVLPWSPHSLAPMLYAAARHDPHRRQRYRAALRQMKISPTGKEWLWLQIGWLN